MKQFRITLPLVALVLAMATSAFSTVHQQTLTEERWFYTLDDADGHNDPENYVPLNGQDSGCPGQSQVNCVIEAPELLDGNGQPTGTPDLSQATVISRKP